MKAKDPISKILDLAIVGLFLSTAIFSAALLFFSDPLFDLVSSFSPDRAISSRGSVTYNIYLFLAALIIVLWSVKRAWVNEEDRVPVRRVPAFMKIFYVLAVLLITANIVFKGNMVVYGEDGIMESLTALMAFVAGLIFFAVAIKRHETFLQRLFFLGFSGASFFLAMEEVSWGQRIIGWETPEYLKEMNHQEESNLHNLFNPYFAVFYLILNGVLAATFFCRGILKNWLESFSITRQLAPFLPGKHFFYTGYIFIFLQLYTFLLERGAETLELFIGLFLLFYARDMLRLVFERKVNVEMTGSTSAMA